MQRGSKLSVVKYVTFVYHPQAGTQQGNVEDILLVDCTVNLVMGTAIKHGLWGLTGLVCSLLTHHTLQPHAVLVSVVHAPCRHLRA